MSTTALCERRAGTPVYTAYTAWQELDTQDTLFSGQPPQDLKTKMLTVLHARKKGKHLPLMPEPAAEPEEEGHSAGICNTFSKYDRLRALL